MPWSTSHRKAGLPQTWASIRAGVRARAGGRCQAVENGQRCLLVGSECHHAGGRDDHDPAVLVWLCADHHRSIKLDEATAARRAMYAKTKMRAEPHPGLVE